MKQTIQTVRLFLLIEAVCFIAAGIIHTGMLVTFDVLPPAAVAESIIGVVLLIGLGLTWIWRSETRIIGLIVQGFAMLGTLVGLFIILSGAGVNAVLNISFHVIFLLVLAWGLVVTVRPSPARGIQA
ncbi:MAG TPA: hypothetical protein VFU63_11215 [Ktedonobacterales bacterium]|nr:hypothetical protein [Ktedonobacterales bacterium]